jgi:hypothetical protein
MEKPRAARACSKLGFECVETALIGSDLLAAALQLFLKSPDWVFGTAV